MMGCDVCAGICLTAHVLPVDQARASAQHAQLHCKALPVIRPVQSGDPILPRVHATGLHATLAHECKI